MSVPYNPSAVLISMISNDAAAQVTTAVNAYTSGTTIVLNVPTANGFLPPAFVNDPKYPNQIIIGTITVLSNTVFTIDFDSEEYTPYVNTLPAYAVPLTYICYNNPNPRFSPAYRLITAVTNAQQASITTSVPHGFSTGTIVRLYLPHATGMGSINQGYGTITVTSPTTFTIPINTTNVNTFSIPSSIMSSDPRVDICSLAVPIGEDNSILNAALQNNGQFIP